MSLNNKIDFAIIFSVKNANPNGDPLNGNRPRVNYDGYGEVSDVCLMLSLTLFDLICLKNSDEHFTPSMVG
jgi:CRISPR/Cas system type I-B associated protein Csh2 (Cas7 group RAMP superfamily)